MRRGTRKMTGGGMGSTILDSDSNPVTDILQLGKVYTVHDNNCGLNYTLKISQPSKDNSTFQVELSDIKSGNLATKLGFGNQFTNFDYLLKSFYGILYSEKGTNTSGKAISSISELFDKAFNINNDKVNIKKILQMKCTPRKIKVGENDDNQTVKHLSQRVTDPNRFAVIDMDIKKEESIELFIYNVYNYYIKLINPANPFVCKPTYEFEPGDVVIVSAPAGTAPAGTAPAPVPVAAPGTVESTYIHWDDIRNPYYLVNKTPIKQSDLSFDVAELTKCLSESGITDLGSVKIDLNKAGIKLDGTGITITTPS